MNPAKIYGNIFLSITNIQASDDCFVGWSHINQDLLRNLKDLSKHGLTYESLDYKINGVQRPSGLLLERINYTHFSEEYLFEIKLIKSNTPTSLECVVCPSWNELLKYNVYIKKSVKSIFFTNTKEYIDIYSDCKKYKNYMALSELYNFVNFLSKESNGDNGGIFYNRNYKFDFKASEDDLIHEIDVDSLKKFQTKDMHREAIINIMCKEVVTLIKDHDEKSRFSYLIRSLNPLITNINHSYQSYVEDYAFDKVRKEYNEKKTEYIKQINDTFDSIVTKMVAVPAGIWFATAQISPLPSLKDKLTNNYDYLLTKNLVVLLAVLLMVAILALNILAQRNTLKQLKSEYNEVFENLKDKFAEERNKLSDVIKDIDKRYRRISFYIYASLLICFILAASVSWLYYKT